MVPHGAHGMSTPRVSPEKKFKEINALVEAAAKVHPRMEGRASRRLEVAGGGSRVRAREAVPPSYACAQGSTLAAGRVPTTCRPLGQRLRSSSPGGVSMDLILPNGMLAQLDDEDADLAALTWRAWFNKGFRKSWMVVRDDARKGRSIRTCLHREVGFRISGLKPAWMVVIPKDRSFLNCTRKNLHVHEMGCGQDPRWEAKARRRPTGYDYYRPPIYWRGRYRTLA